MNEYDYLNSHTKVIVSNSMLQGGIDVREYEQWSIADYLWFGVRRLVEQVVRQASGSPSASHAPFLRYSVDALALTGSVVRETGLQARGAYDEHAPQAVTLGRVARFALFLLLLRVRCS